MIHFLLAFGFYASAPPMMAPVVQERIEVMLNAPETAPSLQEWEALGDHAPRVLRVVASNPAVGAIQRGRALSALAAFGDRATGDFLAGILADTSQGRHVRAKAARALAISQGAKALLHLEAALNAPEARLREAVIKALAHLPAQKVRPTLKRRLPMEPKAYLRDAMTAVIVGGK